MNTLQPRIEPGIWPDEPEAPAGWKILGKGADGFSCTGRGPEQRRLMVIASTCWLSDPAEESRYTERWVHLSVSIDGERLPSWIELEWCKRFFIGADRYAYQVHAPSDAHFSIAEVLHVWARADDGDGQVLPDLRGLGGMI